MPWSWRNGPKTFGSPNEADFWWALTDSWGALTFGDLDAFAVGFSAGTRAADADNGDDGDCECAIRV